YMADTKTDYASTSYLLANLPQLRHLMLINCEAISASDFESLKKEYPDREIAFLQTGGAELKDVIESIDF
ncbi:MAG: hypothetical protein K8F91_03330, partial [Candidatus Obscuribacterales bacterium]|nr:hypothetical protein [Candidatus Obscuribacterales bacterium]